MKTQGVPWAGLWVSDVEAVVAFYCDKLGMAELGRGAGYVHLDAGNDTFLEIFSAPEDNPEVTGRPQQHTWELSFAVDDVDEAIDELTGKGVRLSTMEIGRFRDQRWIRVRDPEGNRIALKEERAQRVPAKQELLDALRASESEAVCQLERQVAGAWERTAGGEGRTALQVLAYIAAMEKGCGRIVALASAPRFPASHGNQSLERYMESQVAQRQGASPAELLAEFREYRAGTIAAVDQATDALLAATIPAPIIAPLATAIYALAVEQMLGRVGEITGGDYLSWRFRRAQP